MNSGLGWVKAWAALLLSATIAPAWAQGGTGFKVQGHFNVLINWIALPSVCATQSGGGSTLGRVVCLSGDSPSFSVPGGAGIFSLTSSLANTEPTSQIPRNTNLSSLSPTAAGSPATANDPRSLESADVSAGPGTPPPEEIEVKF